ncbi:conjugal transfer protein, partial [Yersinia enterocolitica]|nr:conjugal transfer protein [Yersinia enterocolitica]
WQIDGAYFECVDDEDLTILTDQLNTLIRSFEGKAITFYTHRIRVKKEIHTSFNSKIPFVNKVMNEYYDSLTEPEYFENRLYLTICYKVFNVEDKISNFISKKKGNSKVFDEPVNEMNEICGRLDTYLSRFHSRRLALA